MLSALSEVQELEDHHLVLVVVAKPPLTNTERLELRVFGLVNYLALVD